MKTEKILIVDDEEDLCKLFSLYFSLEGYNILTAQDGLTALDIIEKESPDLIVSDIRMPHCDGFCLMEALNSKMHHPTPVIFISGYTGSSGDLGRLSNYPNFLKYFTKPFKAQNIVNEVNNYFSNLNSQPARI
ncbi:MAG: response regulator [Pseudobdellovibrionaceae bacterium]